MLTWFYQYNLESDVNASSFMANFYTIKIIDRWITHGFHVNSIFCRILLIIFQKQLIKFQTEM